MAISLPITPSIRSRSTDEENLLRRALLDCLVAAQEPVAWAVAGEAIGWLPERADAVGAAIVARQLAGLDAAGRVQYAYPVSSTATNQQVRLGDGRTLYAMCAIDALGCCFAFGQPVQIASTCHVCGRSIQISVRGEHEAVSQPAGVYALYMDLSKYDEWATNT